MHRADMAVSDSAGHFEITRRNTRPAIDLKACGFGERCKGGAADKLTHAAWNVGPATELQKRVGDPGSAIRNLIGSTIADTNLTRVAKLDAKSRALGGDKGLKTHIRLYLRKRDMAAIID